MLIVSFFAIYTMLFSHEDASLSTMVATINKQGVEDLFSDILYSNGKITVNEQERSKKRPRS